MPTKLDIALQDINLQDSGEVITKLCGQNVARMTNDELNCFIKLAQELPDKLTQDNLDYLLQMINAYYLLGDNEAMEEWFGLLVKQRSKFGEGTEMRARVEQYICCANVIKPTDNAQVLLTYAILFNEYKNGNALHYRFCPTQNRPSVLSGRIDLSEWGKNFRAVASILAPMLPVVLDGDSEGSVQVAIAEQLYERNKINEASLELATATSSKDIDVAFAALILHAHLMRLDSDPKRYVKILEHVKQMVHDKEAYWLYDNLNAAIIRFDICDGNLAALSQWLEQCPYNEMSKVAPANAYVADTLARVYIALGRLREAVMVFEKLIGMNIKNYRHYDTIDCYINSAIACELMGNAELAFSRLEQALDLSIQYGYIRIFADKGRILFQLLTKYRKEREQKLSGGMQKYIGRIAEAAKDFSLICPQMYAPASNVDAMPELTQSEVQILSMLDEGKTNKEIADAIHITPATVKFHIGNLLEKFQVANRTSLVSEFHKLQKKE